MASCLVIIRTLGSMVACNSTVRVYIQESFDICTSIPLTGVHGTYTMQPSLATVCVVSHEVLRQGLHDYASLI